MNRKTIEEYADTLDQQTINEAQEEFLKELDKFIDNLDKASSYASTIRQFVKNNKDNIETVVTILTFADKIDELLEDINNSFEVM